MGLNIHTISEFQNNDAEWQSAIQDRWLTDLKDMKQHDYSVSQRISASCECLETILEAEATARRGQANRNSGSGLSEKIALIKQDMQSHTANLQQIERTAVEARGEVAGMSQERESLVNRGIKCGIALLKLIPAVGTAVGIAEAFFEQNDSSVNSALRIAIADRARNSAVATEEH